MAVKVLELHHHGIRIGPSPADDDLTSRPGPPAPPARVIAHSSPRAEIQGSSVSAVAVIGSPT